jgi:hypothetical protein
LSPTNDPFKELKEREGLAPGPALAPYVAIGLKVGVAADGASLGALPGASRLYLLAVNQDRILETEEVVDLKALGLIEEPEKEGDLKKYLAALGELASRLKGVSFIAAAKFSGVLPKRLADQGVPYLADGNFSLAWVEGAINAAFSPDESESADKSGAPKEIGPGVYFLDLKAELERDPDLTSKKILKPFFVSANFQKLSIRFDHTPPWLIEAAEKMGYALSSSKDSEESLVVMEKKT